MVAAERRGAALSKSEAFNAFNIFDVTVAALIGWQLPLVIKVYFGSFPLAAEGWSLSG
jgi:hypothetical protein